ncbi:unnamed protein product [Spirodela intermedia]|uniref:Uncharacterized protein n=2 Tax=Spirodela intermedia TaxID=51605 RepID=A0A7I8IBG9_SPIIN|nr:unnamed protein product [Spirodela intermedia]CAA6654683.1 unnamed protein product [Spirodela intermedia]CAA7389338.1 unnamed protein product [Spirodela intermedia]
MCDHYCFICTLNHTSLW